MDPVTAGLVTGIGGGLMGAFGASSANDTAKDIARVNRRFTERMSSTAYQRAVKDAQAAGLNPALVYGQGGAQGGSGTTPNIENVGEAAAEGARGLSQAAASVALTRAQIRKTEAETKTEDATRDVKVQLLLAQGKAADASGLAAGAQGQLYGQEYRFREAVNAARAEVEKMYPKLTAQEQEMLAEQIAMLKLQMPALRNRAAFDNTWFGRAAPAIDQLVGIGRALPGGSTVGKALDYIRQRSQRSRSTRTWEPDDPNTVRLP